MIEPKDSEPKLVPELGSQEMIDAMSIAGYHIEAGIRRFDEYAIIMVDEVGDWIKPYLKMIYTSIRDYPGMEEIAINMDSYEFVHMFNLDELFTTEVNSEDSFHLEAQDYEAIKIAQSTMRKLLKRPGLTPRQIIAIGNYLFALERLPKKTLGVNSNIQIQYRNGDEEFSEAKYFDFLIREDVFHIDISGSIYDRSVGSDANSYPGWYVEASGGRDTDCQLDFLEDEINEFLSLGAKISVEDYSEIEFDEE